MCNPDEACPDTFFTSSATPPLMMSSARILRNKAKRWYAARELAHHLANEKPHLARDGNAIMVVAEDGRKVETIPLG